MASGNLGTIPEASAIMFPRIDTVLAVEMSANLVFPQGRGFVIGASIGLLISFAPLSRVGLQRRGNRLFGNVISFW